MAAYIPTAMYRRVQEGSMAQTGLGGCQLLIGERIGRHHAAAGVPEDVVVVTVAVPPLQLFEVAVEVFLAIMWALTSKLGPLVQIEVSAS